MIPEPASGPSELIRSSSQDEANSSGALNNSEDESGNENRQKRGRRRKRTLKEVENVTCKKAKSRRRCHRKDACRREREHAEAVTLFDVISMGPSAMQVVIDGWAEAYAADRDGSLLDLISFFIQCCGCKGVVTAEMCDTKGGGETLYTLAEELVEDLDEVASLQYKKFLAFPWILTVTWPTDADSPDYPLTQPGPRGRWFHAELSDFVSVLVRQCQESLLFDSYLVNTLISLLSELSDSHVRAFRHTCTLAAVKLLSSLMDVAINLSASVEKSQKLQRAQRPSRQKAQAELARKNVKELLEKRAEIESMMDTIFKAVFLKRYRDVLPEIRSICVEELGLWMRRYSSVFLNDTYLKYLDWMSYDKIPDVRLKCVLGLQTLYGDPLLLPQLDLFTSRFKDRMISMTLDKDNEVALQSMKLALLVSKTCEDALSSDDYGALLQLVYSSQRPLAAAAGELLFLRILSARDPAPVRHDGIIQGESHKGLTRLLDFYKHSKLHKHVVYLVDSLWDCAGALLKDWPAITSLLLQDPGTGLAGEDQAALVEIALASVRQASEGPALAGRSGAKKVMSSREKKVQVDDCAKVTQHFLRELPTLMSKFSGRWDVVASLVRIPQYFLPESPEAQNAQMFSRLLAEMVLVLEVHSGEDVLEATSRTFLSLCAEESAWATAARPVRDSMVGGWVDHLKELLSASFTDGLLFSDETQTADFLVTLKKVRAFHNCHDLSGWNLFHLLSPLLPAEGDRAGLPASVLTEVLQCLCYCVFWSLSKSDKILTSRDASLSQRLQLRVLCEASHRGLAHPDHRVRRQAFLGVCDILTAHSSQRQAWHPTSGGPLPYTPTPKLQMALLHFVCKNVFVGPDCVHESKALPASEEEKMEVLHRRRSTLAAYCKLVLHGVLEMSMAADIFTFYAKHHNDLGDIIKETIHRCRLVDKLEGTRALVTSLQRLFVHVTSEREGDGSPNGRLGERTLAGVKELARRLALTFGDVVKFRECLVLIHRSGIEFVFRDFSPALLPYLSILSEFSGKLLKADKRSVLTYLQRHASALEVEEEPLLYYRASLLAEGDTDAVRGRTNAIKGKAEGPSNKMTPQRPAGKTPAPFDAATSDQDEEDDAAVEVEL
ncbi:cohesin subunit SA-2 [Stigmatopora argus]